MWISIEHLIVQFGSNCDIRVHLISFFLPSKLNAQGTLFQESCKKNSAELQTLVIV